ncbi:hypothetical protein FQN50_008415 [Emmonsiellopsis sp. PD_5]|nr:hypothetical protein FQN50_008415 [Emmonsiellopsis sp. PD_5]
MADGQPVLGSLYVYAPNKGAPIFFTVAFVFSAIGHIWQCYKYKSFRLIGLHPFCAVVLASGYALRVYGAMDNYLYSTTTNLIIFILSQVFIYICPPLLELANYHILARILHYIPHLSPLPPGKILSIFGGLIALVEALNALGVSLSANPSSSKTQQETGGYITIAALVLQLLVILIFICIAAIFHHRCTKASIVCARPVQTPLITLYISMSLIFIRCIYRLIQHTGHTTIKIKDPDSLGKLTPLLRVEWFFYVFEAALILINSVLWNLWNPGRYFPRNSRVRLARDGRTEVEGDERKEDDRPLLMKAGSVLTFGMFWRKKEGGWVAGGAELDEYQSVAGGVSSGISASSAQGLR